MFSISWKWNYIWARERTLRGKLAQYYYEAITLLVYIWTFILSLQDTFTKPSDTFRLIFSTSITNLNTTLVVGSLGFMFIEIYEAIRLRNKARKRKQAQDKSEDHQETQNLTQTAGPLQPPNRKGEQTASIDNFYLLPGVNQNGDVTAYDLNMETSQARELNFNADNSRGLEMDPSTRPPRLRRRLRTLKNSSIYPSEQSPNLWIFSFNFHSKRFHNTFLPFSY